MAEDNILKRKIGDKTVMVAYEEGGMGYASQMLDKEEAAYLEAEELAGRAVVDLVSELEGMHYRLEEFDQETCVKCGHRSLKDRRGRMRVFGGLFWTNSEPAPYKRCADCGHDQETKPFQTPHLPSLNIQATRRIERAKKLVAKYTKPTQNNSKGKL